MHVTSTSKTDPAEPTPAGSRARSLSHTPRTEWERGPEALLRKRLSPTGSADRRHSDARHLARSALRAAFLCCVVCAGEYDGYFEMKSGYDLMLSYRGKGYCVRLERARPASTRSCAPRAAGIVDHRSFLIRGSITQTRAMASTKSVLRTARTLGTPKRSASAPTGIVPSWVSPNIIMYALMTRPR